MSYKFDWGRLGAALLVILLFAGAVLVMYGLAQLFFVVLPPILGVWTYIIPAVLALAGMIAAIYHDMGKQEDE